MTPGPLVGSHRWTSIFVSLMRRTTSQCFDVRVEPYVVPKVTLTNGVTERVDTRVLQVISALDPRALPVRVGQQLDVFIDAR